MADRDEASKPTKKVGKPKNYVIGKGGLMRYSRSTMYAKKARYRWAKPGQSDKTKTKRRQFPPRMVKKQIGGEKNGGERTVRVNRMPRSYPTQERPHKLKSRQKCFSQHTRYLRPSITPGTVLILVAGRHKGKKVIFLKALATGLLLVTGPFKLNGCPLRRVNQIYVIATKTKLDISKVTLPERLNDEYFRRMKKRRSKQAEGEIFETKKQVYQVSDVRKEDQVAVDSQILDVVRQRPDKKLMFGYLGSLFSLGNRQFPHAMVF